MGTTIPSTSTGTSTQNNSDLFVKCVVVGDPGVGKTCLICARACNTKYSLEQLVKTHVSTVWAIDHYRTDREILERSWGEVDGVNVSLRLWDTFGYHDKARRFAFSRADVVLLCFSTVCPSSLRNVRKIWYPEIRKYCPSTPIIVVGTQIDLRYLYCDDKYLKMDKGLMYREIQKIDIITPEQARAVAMDLGLPYYEASVLTRFGVDDVFDNVIRAALCDRRKVRFWNAELRKVKHPQRQSPMNLPKPDAPRIIVPPATLSGDLGRLLFHQMDCDVIFVVRGVCFQAHKIVLIVAANVFYQLFTLDISDIVTSPTSSDSLPASSDTSATDLTNDDLYQDDDIDDRQLLLDNQHGRDYNIKHSENAITISHLDAHKADFILSTASSSSSSHHLSDFIQVPYTYFSTSTLPPKELSHPAFQTLQLKQCDNPYSPGQFNIQTVVTVNPDISPKVFEYIIEYLYTGEVREDYDLLDQFQRAAELMQLKDLAAMISNLINHREYLNASLQADFQKRRCQRLREIALEKGMLTDVTFDVDDGMVSAHKSLLMARCDVMFAMFTNDFLESSAKLISFPGISMETFHSLQEYLYTGQYPQRMSGGVDAVDLIEVANRLCLQRLIRLTEEYVINELMRQQEAGEDILEEVCMMLEPAQLLNADQLAKWCLYQLCTHFRDLTKKHTKLWKALSLDNQIYIDKKRWPPQWYLKELEAYEHAKQDSVRNHLRQSIKRQRSSGCLCFMRMGRVKVQRSLSEESA